ncbi:hypothetical protein A3I41_01665 [Candidatus Uhrbacteria bacterium RIFCSPLOWO2_02_FULL_48_18]|uniref:Uncharacterized protein n=1 Tax=Candidatus Uhrbacteria bacterium RIFCSPLOWO2_02_FULL_48_18 TaxID=1802408 RepID=A0A1F7V715_9BACT|nr:MAG: hypothetical protein A3B20_03175 [Candidatus Uhrbacteria bacterium RIFCSPLOWO2_01_FULL_47_17]OGL86251.1 MAG: hypothetical protein A3I41_01665 [Candidatus Uhrbacteria bacterium RIFCSPLOWO2_02_FULL_48_18]
MKGRKSSTRSGEGCCRAGLKNESLRAPLDAAEVLPGATLVRAIDVIVRVADVRAARAEGERLEIGIASVHLERLMRAKLLGRLHVTKAAHCLTRGKA